MSWTPERLEHLRTLLAGGATASQAGTALGATRNAVIGKAHRMGFALRSRNTGGYYEHKQIRVSIKRRALPPKPRPGPPRAPRVKADELRVIPIFCEPVGLLGLTPVSCRWPVSEADGDHLFCGAAQAPGGSYCAGHARIAFKAPSTTAKELARSLRRFAA